MRLSIAFLAAFGCIAPASAGGMAIDPDPTSPTIGEMLRAEAEAMRARPSPAAPSPAIRAIRAEPHVPRNAVTVWVPGRRAR